VLTEKVVLATATLTSLTESSNYCRETYHCYCRWLWLRFLLICF